MISLLLFHCKSSDLVYQEKIEIDVPYWFYDHLLEFDFTVEDELPKNGILKFDVSQDLPFQNIYIRKTLITPDQDTLRVEKSLEYLNPLGYQFGKKINQRTRRISLPVEFENVDFSQPGEYILLVEQYTRRDSLPGVLAVRFDLSYTN